MTLDSSNYETSELDDLDSEELYDDSEFLEDYEFEDLKPCPACFGTGLDRELDSDCLTCWGDGVV